MLLKTLSYLPAAIGVFLIGLFVLLNNPKRKLNRYFFVFNFTVGAWLLALYVADISSNDAVALWAIRFALFVGTFVFLAFMYFAMTFPTDSKISKRVVIALSAPLVIAALFSFTPASVGYVEITEFGAQPQDIGLAYTVADVLSIFYVIFGVGLILGKYKQANNSQKQQTRFFLYGLAIAVIVNVFTGFILTHLGINTSATYLGGFSLLIFSGFVAYAIAKHGLFDTRFIVARALAYTLLVVTLGAVYTLAVFGISSWVFGAESVVSQQIIPIVAAVVLVFTAPVFKQFFDKLTNEVFYQDAYDPRVFINELNQAIVKNIEIGILLRQVSKVIEDNLKSEYCLIAIKDPETGELKTRNIIEKKISGHDLMVLKKEMSERSQNLVVNDDIDIQDAELKKVLVENNIAVVRALVEEYYKSQEAIAYLILGPKKSGNTYNKEDLRMIQIISSELLIAIQNALRFEEIQQFNVVLQEKVEEATAKLRRTNQKLKELDDTKDEFISMASHQLRTPLTSVKGYLSMVIEGDAGDLNEQQKSLLGQAFTSSQRMVYLIADLLNVSRLKTGKFVIMPSETHLEQVVEDEVAQLKEQAKAKNITVKYKKPDEFPVLMLDETKIRQVIMNFCDNAIYYTPQGGTIKIDLRCDKGSVYFMVKDDGLGVPKEEQGHLFTKFYRATNARSARPDGTGLGLFMAKKVITAQDGEILFHSVEGKGSTFGFSFKRSKLEPKAAK